MTGRRDRAHRHGPDRARTSSSARVSLDIYLGRDLVLPGGGVLNMAWRWRRAGVPFRLLSRVGDDRPDVFRTLPRPPRRSRPSPASSPPADRRRSTSSSSPTSSRTWTTSSRASGPTFRLRPDEEALVRRRASVHLVLVEGAIRELRRLAADGLDRGVEVSADFLGFRHYTVERFADTMTDVDIGFVGWPGGPDDPAVGGHPRASRTTWAGSSS